LVSWISWIEKWDLPISLKDTLWLFNVAMENPPILKNGKASISMGHFPWICEITRG
jgi:hypothetical protein